jgi:hypothetical protein
MGSCRSRSVTSQVSGSVISRLALDLRNEPLGVVGGNLEVVFADGVDALNMLTGVAHDDPGNACCVEGEDEGGTVPPGVDGEGYMRRSSSTDGVDAITGGHLPATISWRSWSKRLRRIASLHARAPKETVPK